MSAGSTFPEIFSRHAAAYRDDRMGAGRIPLARTELVLAMAVRPGETVLDLACGPGTITLPLAAAAGPDGRVVAGDLADGMLDLLRQVAPPNVEARRLDIEDPAVEPGTFDVVTCAHGYQFVADLARALAGARRALRAGGRFGFTVPGRSREHAVDEVVAILESGPEGLPDMPGRESTLQTLDQPAALAAALEAAGFESIVRRDVVETYQWPDAGVAYRKLATNWRVAERLSRMTPDRRAEVELRVRAALARQSWPVTNHAASVLVTAVAG